MAYQKENNIKKTEMLTNVNGDDNEKENSEVNHVTEIKIENNTFSSKLIDSEHNRIEFENVVIKMEQESIIKALVNQDEIESVVSQNNINFKANKIKKENENQDFEENIHERYENILETFNSYNDEVKIKVEENYDYSLYSEKCTNDPLTNLQEMKIDIIENDIESVNVETNVKYKSEDIEESSEEDHAIPSEEEDDINKETITLHKFLEVKQEQQTKCDLVNRNVKIAKEHECSICKKNFLRSTHLITHMKIHSGEKSHECSVCQKKFARSDNLKVHMRIHTGDKPYECDVCQKKFTQSYSLKEHMKTHTGDKQYECDVCQRKFSRSQHLIGHMRMHSGEKTHECSVCQKKLANLYNLKEHMNTHTGIKPYECNVCQKKFAQSSTLKMHMKLHIGDKLYECDVCQKKFHQSHHLKEHMRIHTGEKPYQCDVCQKKFTRPYRLKDHMLIHTEVK